MDDKENEIPSTTAAPVKTTKPSAFVARRTTPSQPRGPSTRPSASALLDSVATALDPSVRQARQETLSLQLLQGSQISQLNSQLRDGNRRIDFLTSQLAEAERRYQDAERRFQDSERRADKATQKAELLDILTKRDLPSPHIFPTTPRQPSRPSRPHYHQDIFYRDGGRATRWYGGDLSDDPNDDACGLNDSPGTIRVTALAASPPRSTSGVTDKEGSSSSMDMSVPPRMRHSAMMAKTDQGV